jgi:exosortase O
LIIALALVGLLLTANLARVATLVIVGQLAGLRILAEMLHVPLGVIGFVVVCGTAVALLRRIQTKNHNPENRHAAETPKPVWLAGVLVFSIITMGVLYTPRPASLAPQPIRTLHFPAELQVEAMPLSQDELEWLNEDGAASAERWRFDWRGYSGSFLFVYSRTWRSQHSPERCFTVYGLSVENSHTYLAAPDFPIRMVSLDDGKGNPLYSAVYWFQSQDRVTEDHATRIWADLEPQREAWVLATILFDEPAELQTSDLRELYSAVRLAIHGNL